MSTERSCKPLEGEGRRSANYHCNIWDADSIHSLLGRNGCMQGWDHDHHKRLKQAVQGLLQDITEPHDRLRLIDAVQRLGVAYHFEEQISDALCGLYANNSENEIDGNLYTTALYFRLLRQHGYNVSSDIFSKFKDDKGGFKASLCEDVMGLLSMYEASHLGLKGETILDKAKAFSTENLKILMKHVELNLAKRIEHALELPLHWRSPRLEARHYIDVYEEEDGRIHDLLDLAKLDFNLVQTVHQTELVELSNWWDFLGLGGKMGFMRDRLMESFLLAVGVIFEPQYSECRKAITKAIAFITAIDDFYDVHGSPDELKAFTDAVNRWDLEVMDQLPEYMKLCYLALHNTTNEIAYVILKEKGFTVLQYLKELWAMQCNSYFLEAQWFNSGYKTKFNEYLPNARVSIGVPLVLGLSYTLLQHHITKEELNCIDKDLNLIRWASIIFRLCDDLGTSKAEQERGDVPKSIQCYMHETGDSEELAREHIRGLISDAWKGLNEECLKNTNLPKHFINAHPNAARIGLIMYQHDSDGFGVSNQETKAHITSLFLEPVPLNLSAKSE